MGALSGAGGLYLIPRANFIHWQKVGPPVTRNARILLTTLVVGVLVAATTMVLLLRDAGAPAAPQAETSAMAQVVRDNSHRLSSVPESDVNFVEFLDFECEGCKALYPVVEKLRAEYGDRVNFVIRYFPLKAHFNSERAARAVEAAAQQGQLEAMYKKMYDSQSEWGEQQTPADATFRGYAGQLGLDIADYDAAYNDPATLERVQLDVADGKALGVQGTPTFFVNETRLQPRSYEDLTNALDEALAK